MGVENLRAALPEYAKDLKLNLGSITRSTVLGEERLWGTLLASAAATRNDRVLTEIGGEAAEYLSAEAYRAALGAAAIMAMNNVFYRARGFLDGAYDDLRAGLRMNIIGSPGVEKATFELWCFAVSSINGCPDCLTAHEHTLREAGIDREAILEALKAAAVVAGVAQAIATVQTLAVTGPTDTP
ncbi:carboxymuconolactone decarboxylase family protein [Mycobacterium sp.]|uniref:carboxymuconolactone decarboxylase family protein n=1 Tax=Mycobacterium sp. TaxID=1785 RepID=UPI001273DF00|nr:carboxymuconolactone decarboxylase family protein [Mycobacterium sp.]KAA8960491.1 MAG: alkyl hydroperoxide reductase [Mycobacterium sp.]